MNGESTRTSAWCVVQIGTTEYRRFAVLARRAFRQHVLGGYKLVSSHRSRYAAQVARDALDAETAAMKAARAVRS